MTTEKLIENLVAATNQSRGSVQAVFSELGVDDCIKNKALFSYVGGGKKCLGNKMRERTKEIKTLIISYQPIKAISLRNHHI